MSLLAAAGLLGGTASAQEVCEPVVGRLASLEGEVDVQRSGTGTWQAAELDQVMCQGDSVRTGLNSRAALSLISEAVLRLDETTTVRLVDIVAEEEGTSFLQLLRGIFQSFSRSPRNIAIDTPYMNATTEGTEFALAVGEDRSTVTVLEGVVAVENDQGEARVASGEAAVAEAGQAPRQVIVVTPRDAVQWSLYYPPVIALQVSPGSGLDPDVSPPLRRALELAGQGRTNDALTTLDQVPEGERDATWHVYRGSLLLSVGQVEQAERAIERALSADPEIGTAHALRSIIHVVQNEVQEALAAARRGVELSPEASAPKVALSYALQATFDLEGARDVLLEAIEQDPESSLLWSRLAELHLSLGGRRQASEAAERAVELASAPGRTRTTSRPPGLVVVVATYAVPADRGPGGAARRSAPRDERGAAAPSPLARREFAQAAPATPPAPAPAPAIRSPELERALMVLGFVNLAEFDTAEARQNFTRAIALNPADPLPHFGLGLAQIRDGELEVGRQNIEVAVALDSSSSVLRSYLGKAYFEEKRDELAAQQFEIAKELDPLDPTPYLYDAIRKQTEGRPVEALQDLQRSIELNDNRAVYRSRLQLDEDRAARGTSVGRIYDSLGFQQLGLNVAGKSVAEAPSNAATHRFLADVYSGLRRREIARVSELLQAQLLQDININPVQPSVSETNLNIVTSGGPADVGFNEFTPLFERQQAQLNLSGVAGNHDTLGGEAVASTLFDRYSLSAGAFHFQTEGFRDNHEIEHDIYNIFGQVALTPELNAQIELRRRRTEQGDIALNFDPDVFSETRDRSLNEDVARLGLRYSPAAHSDLLFSAILSDREEGLDDAQPFEGQTLTIDGDNQDDGYQLEGQYIFQTGPWNAIAGLAHSNIDRDTTITFALDGVPVADASSDTEFEHNHAYSYLNLNLPRPVIWTLGLSYDDYSQGSANIDNLNPKLGVQWDVLDDLTFRAAVLRVLKPSIVNNRTVEPTQVAGFNQFFDDGNGTESWRYGVGLDWQALSSLFLGAEASWRDLTEVGFLEEDAVFEDRSEQLHRLYAYWTPFEQIAVTGQVIYDLYEADRGLATDFGDLPLEVETISVPLSIRYFAPNGLFAGVGATLVHQEVERSELSVFAEGSDDFVTVDASVGYRFPKRLGIASLEVRNLFDTEFEFQDDSFREFSDQPSIGPYIPALEFVGRVALNF